MGLSDLLEALLLRERVLGERDLGELLILWGYTGTGTGEPRHRSHNCNFKVTSHTYADP